jgi:hypothetical protein
MKKGGAWVPVPANQRQNQGGVEPPMGQPGPDMQEGGMLEPPNPVENKMNTRSLASMATHGNDRLVMDKQQQIKDMIKSIGVNEAISLIKESFENAGAGDLFDESMPLDQLAEIAARNDVDFPYDEGDDDNSMTEEEEAEYEEDIESNYESMTEEEIDAYEESEYGSQNGWRDATNWGSDVSFDVLEANNNLNINMDDAIADYIKLSGIDPSEVDGADAYDSALVEAINEGKISADDAVFANGRNRAWLDDDDNPGDDGNYDDEEDDNGESVDRYLPNYANLFTVVIYY